MVMTGKTISHYKILDKLGEGGMGVVYKAHDTKLDRTVALKFFPPNLAVDDTEKQRFLHEARAASALDHSNICSTYSIEETDDGSMFIVMAYYDGVSLQGKIGQSPLPIKEVLAYSIQIAAGLKKAHEKEIVHRDLKPANIFITKDDQIKIIDFGLAKAAHRTMLTKSGTTLGTVPYMSPEQAQGNQADNRTDIWSLGVVMYEMITGRRPFKSEYETALVYSIINEDPEPVTGLRSGVPMGLERVINKCMEKDPSARYQRVDEILVDLRKIEKESVSPISDKTSASVASRHKHPVHKAEKTGGIRKISLLWFVLPTLLVVGMLAYIFIPGKTETQTTDRSIAVLPLENLSPDPDDAYFAAGIHEDIIIQLSRIGDLQVIARSSVLRYAPGERNIRRISNELGVDVVLEGSVRRSADRVRVSATLTDVVTNRTLWADSFDRNLTDIFDIQSEIAREITSALETSLTESERKYITERPTEITEAYEYYLRAREYFNKPGALEENFLKARDQLEQSVRLDSKFAHAYALLSRTYSSLAWFRYDQSPGVLNQARQHAERALQLRPDLPEPHIAMGYYEYHGHRNYDKALEYFNNARRSQPNNAEVIAAIGFVERRLGRFDDSIRNVDKAISLDPLNLALIYNNAMSYMLAGRNEEAHAMFEKTLSIMPDFHTLRIMHALNVIIWKGDVEWLRAYLRQNTHLRELFPGDWIRLHFVIRDYEAILKTVREVPQDTYGSQLYLFTPSYLMGLSYDYLGDSDQAQQYYEKALIHFQELESTNRDEPRYYIWLGKIYAGLGLKDEAVANGKKGVEMITQSVDALQLPAIKEVLAEIYAQVNKPSEAVEVLRELSTMPNYTSVHRWRVEPWYDSIRDTPEFQQLLLEFDAE
jgi:eukaryotic-like serine/threonine-protein kinase